MPDAEIGIFDLHGKSVEDQPSRTSATPEVSLSVMMNARANEIEKSLEREILSALPPDPMLVVRAEVRFQEGSLIMVGTVAILSWAGSAAIETVKEEVAAIIKIAVQRVLAATIAQALPAIANRPTMQCSVKAREQARPAASVVVRAPGALQTIGNWRDAVLIFLTVAVLILLLTNLVDRGARATFLTPPAPSSSHP